MEPCSQGDRITRLEAEVMGDELTSRPSLRADLTDKLGKIQKTIYWIGGLIITLLATNLFVGK